MARRSRPPLAETLAAIPLYGQRNRVKVAVAILNRNYYDVAAGIGINRSTLSQIVNGQIEPSEETRVRIAGYFGVPVDVLFPLRVKAA